MVIRHYTNGHIPPDEWIATDLTFKEVRMIADFSELHYQVHQILHLVLVLSHLH